MKLTHDQLQESLAAHLRGSTERLVWTNTQLGPVGSPRPDVFTVNTSFSKPRTDAYEVKFSRADLLRDVTSGKWQSYRKFANCVWFAFEHGLVQTDLIPRECGIITHRDGAWRSARKPVAQVLDTLPREAWLKLVMTPAKGGEVPQPRSGDVWAIETSKRIQNAKLIAGMIRDRDWAATKFAMATQEMHNHANKLREQMQGEEQRQRDMRQREQTMLTAAQQGLAQELGIVHYNEATIDQLTDALRRMREALRRIDIVKTLEPLTMLASTITTNIAENAAVRDARAVPMTELPPAEGAMQPMKVGAP